MTQEQIRYDQALLDFRRKEDAWLRVEARRVELIWDRQTDLLTPGFLGGIKSRHADVCRAAEELRKAARAAGKGAPADAEYACGKNGF